MQALFKSDKFSQEKQFEKLNKLIKYYQNIQVGLDTLHRFINDILFNQMETSNTNILPVIDNFVYYITNDIPLEIQKQLYIEYLYIDENSPTYILDGKLYSLKRWRKDHEQKDVKTRKIRTKELNVKLALKIVKTCIKSIENK